MEHSRFSPIVRFGIYEADLTAGELRKNGLKVKLQGKPFEIMTVLLEHPGEVVSREQLHKRLWPADIFVDFDHGLNNAMNKFALRFGRFGGQFPLHLDGRSAWIPIHRS